MDFLLIIAIALVLNLVLIAIAIMDIMQRQNVKYLSKAVWIILMAFVLFGAVIYLALGRGEDSSKDKA